ncbi:hypothetical protein AX16_000057 [Volvariella volvacea WC 439]|nr:hypothetical protein AX16_000057 [Volvariella volvacea WC 439]
MSGIQPTTTHGSELQSSGTTAPLNVDVSPDLERLIKTAQIAPLERPSLPKSQGEEQALETHEVIELQTFSERKAWIEEKIKFLEAMPPIEVFVGMESIKSSAEEVPGLPTRDELQRWLAEHDIIEKETEIFDTGELKKLRQLTKAATQRNLSPQDTDVIELTLTTIYALDKLLHLLRDRSENLELLGIRLTWEENRIAAWIARRILLQDLHAFLDTRARWSPSVYDNMPVLEDTSPLPTLKRRGSMTSLTSSVASDTSSLLTATLSRSSRFKMAEILSRDAAQFGARVTSLRHGTVAAAGKALDKLIDHSRKPVPEPLLDEQDRLEEKTLNELEHIGKFVMNVIMQWRKADEIYVETTKDQATAQNLMEEIETAKLHHPTARQSASFISRADALLKRLALRGNPVSPTSTFPRPEHALFPEQRRINENLAQQLSAEIISATDLARKVDVLAKDYRATWDAVKRAETLTQSANELSGTFETLAGQLLRGVPAGVSDGDGSPPDLNSDSCLDPTRHSVFLALLPNILDSYTQADQAALSLVNTSNSILAALTFEGIDPAFPSTVQSTVDSLSAKWNRVKTIVGDTTARVSRLRESRKLWNTLLEHQKQVEDIRQRLSELIEMRKWKRPTSDGDQPLALSSHRLTADMETQLQNAEINFSRGVVEPFSTFSVNLEHPLKSTFSENIQNIRNLVAVSRRMMALLESLDKQAVAVESLRMEFRELLDQINEASSKLANEINYVLSSRAVGGDTHTTRDSPDIDIQSIEENVKTFIQNLSSRVPFASGQLNPHHVVDGISMNQSQPDLDLSFDLATQDDAIRADCNSFAMTLNGRLEALNQSKAQLNVARIAKRVDSDLSAISVDIGEILDESDGYQRRFKALSESESSTLDDLIAISEDVEETLQSHLTRLSTSIATIRDTLRTMSEMPGVQDPSAYNSLYLPRCKATDEVETDFKAWLGDSVSLSKAITAAIAQKQARLEELRIAEEQRLEAERRRLAAEEQERLRLEKERQEEEQRQLAERLRMEEEERMEAERLQREADEAERLRIEKERLEQEELRRLEGLRAAELKRQEEEQAERARLKKERLEMEEKLRLVEGQLALERQLQLERERVSAQETERLRQEAERIIQLRAEEQKRASEELRKAIEEERLRVKKEAEEQSSRASEDAFVLRVASSSSQAKSPETVELQAQILALRKRLRTLSADEVIRPSRSASQFPSEEVLKWKISELEHISAEVSQLPASIGDPSVNTELRSLKVEAETCAEWIKRLTNLLSLSDSVKSCDAALSDLLEHIDSYPALPLGTLVSPYRDAIEHSAEEQLSARMEFTKGTVENMKKDFAPVFDDPRALSEKNRIIQAWSELEDMGVERIGGKKSRPPSVDSSHTSTSAGKASTVATTAKSGTSGKKSGAFSNLSTGTSEHSRRLGAPGGGAASRRVVSGSGDRMSAAPSRAPVQRPPSQLSNRLSTRSTSGPLSQSIYASTFASRQRTNSITPSSASDPPTSKRAPTPSGRRSLGNSVSAQTRRIDSPSISETSTLSRPVAGSSRPSSSTSNWSRAPRNSLSGLVPRGFTPKKPSTPPKPRPVQRKKYIADPKSKLDMAVGDVVNQLPLEINITIEGVTNTWKDQSGKYWIGDQDPKLCFCRILRSHTVMVRVGGGWQELSKFIRDHFAESFRLVPESPQSGTEEKWISAMTLLEQAEAEAEQEGDTVPEPPRTPEPKSGFVPSFTLSSPNGRSPGSITSNPTTPKGSPLAPIQFMRRADPELLLRPGTPTKPPLTRSRSPAPAGPARNSVWRP